MLPTLDNLRSGIKTDLVFFCQSDVGLFFLISHALPPRVQNFSNFSSFHTWLCKLYIFCRFSHKKHKLARTRFNPDIYCVVFSKMNFLFVILLLLFDILGSFFLFLGLCLRLLLYLGLLLQEAYLLGQHHQHFHHLIKHKSLSIQRLRLR